MLQSSRTVIRQAVWDIVLNCHHMSVKQAVIRSPEGGSDYLASFVRIPLADGGSVLVETREAPDGGPVKTGRMSDAIENATTTLQEALDSVQAASQAVLTQLRKAGPDKIEVEFGVTLNAKLGAVIAKSESGCHLTVTLSWQRQTAGGEPPTQLA